MKKILSIVLMTVIFAGSAYAQITVTAGYGLATHTAKIKSGSVTEKEDPLNMSGIYVGASYEFGLLSKSWGDLSINPGLTYSFYGKTIEAESEEISGVKITAKEARYDHNIDVPVNVKYSYNILPGKLKLSGYAGPVFSFGLAATQVSKATAGDDWGVERVNLYTGSVKTKSVVAGEKNSEKVKGEGTDYSMFDLKLGIGVSANLFETVDVYIGYNIGLLDRYTEPKSDVRAISHTNVLQVGVAYSF